MGFLILNGPGDPTISPTLYTVDNIELSFPRQQRIIDEATKIYQEGGSLREIEATLQIPRTTIREKLLGAGIGLRPKTSKDRPAITGVTPYGYLMDRGKLVEDPREQKVVRQIIKLWQKGLSFRAIARTLNGQGVKPRSGKSWDHSVVKSVINKHKDQIT